jgi:hypothetical protein
MQINKPRRPVGLGYCLKCCVIIERVMRFKAPEIRAFFLLFLKKKIILLLLVLLNNKLN